MAQLYYRECLFFSGYFIVCYQLQHCGIISGWNDRMMSKEEETISTVGSRLSGGRLTMGFVWNIDWCVSFIR
jgi:hypothetical protein